MTRVNQCECSTLEPAQIFRKLQKWTTSASSRLSRNHAKLVAYVLTCSRDYVPQFSGTFEGRPPFHQKKDTNASSSSLIQSVLIDQYTL